MSIQVAAVTDGLNSLWREIQSVEQTGSTNDDLLAEAARGSDAGLVRVAELQTAGRGRLDRRWEAPAGTSLTFSMLLRPSAPIATWGWIPLIVGLGVHDALRAAGADVHLKWPNDVQLGPDRRKAGGILVQATTGAAVVGIGLNARRHDGLLPTAAAIDEQWDAPREEILRAVLNALAGRYAAWDSADGGARRAGLLAAYRAACATIGQRVRVELPAGGDVYGHVSDVDDEGRLVVRRDDGTDLVVGAGDVTHVRPASG